MNETTLGVVPCGKSKLWDTEPDAGAVEASRAYTGPFHGLAKRYAELKCDRYVILSAKHGFLLPSDKIPGPYNATFASPGDDGLVTDDELRTQVEKLGLDKATKVVVCGGVEYAKRVKTAFAGAQCVVETPLEGKGGMGHLMKWLRSEVDAMDGKQGNPVKKATSGELPTLKVADPAFLVARLVEGDAAGVLVPGLRKDARGVAAEQFLVDSGSTSSIHAIVTAGEPQALANGVTDLSPDLRATLCKVDADSEATAVAYRALTLVDMPDEPLPLTRTPPGDVYGAAVDLGRDVAKAGAGSATLVRRSISFFFLSLSPLVFSSKTHPLFLSSPLT